MIIGVIVGVLTSLLTSGQDVQQSFVPYQTPGVILTIALVLVAAYLTYLDNREGQGTKGAVTGQGEDQDDPVLPVDKRFDQLVLILQQIHSASEVLTDDTKALNTAGQLVPGIFDRFSDLITIYGATISNKSKEYKVVLDGTEKSLDLLVKIHPSSFRVSKQKIRTLYNKFSEIEDKAYMAKQAIQKIIDTMERSLPGEQALLNPNPQYVEELRRFVRTKRLCQDELQQLTELFDRTVKIIWRARGSGLGRLLGK